jgi:hypothetical protein
MKDISGKRVVISVVIVVAWVALASLTGTRRVSGATFFTVINLNDNGLGSLRQAILDANATAGADTINFDPSVTGTITLTTGQLPVISENLTIVGSGASVITVSGNHAPGSIFEIASGVIVTISDLTISDGFAFRAGGILNNGGMLFVSNCTLSGSSASAGGGISNIGGTVTITKSTFSGNTASGGGIFNQGGTVNIASSTISNNFAAGGGGIFNQGGTVTVTNSTISNNSATLGGFAMGGAIFIDSGTVNIANSTLSGNLAINGGGGIRVIGGTVNIKNTILANSTGGDCSVASPGILNGLGVNFSTDGSCLGFNQVTATQLNLGPLVVNQPGTTATHALLPGSVAIDAVTDCTDVAGNLVTQDQRGVTRPIDGNSDGIAQCDVGAYEATAFDLCLQDDSNGNLLQINSTTGDYLFTNCRNGITLSGTGKVTNDLYGCKITLQDMGRTPKRPDRSVLVQANRCTQAARASIRIFSTGSSFSITDSDITNNICACR